MKKRKKLITIGIIVLVVLLVIVSVSNSGNITYATGDTLVDVVIRKSQGTTWSGGASGVYNTKYTKEDNSVIGSDYRYIGANVSNYVKFNNDMYQIIGVFDENTHGQPGQQLVKLIRDRVLGSYSWGVYNNDETSGSYSGYTNDWTGGNQLTPANLNILLNQYFLNKTFTSQTYGNCSDWTYFYQGEDYKTKNCQKIVGYGIDDNVRDYIETVTWHLNGYNGPGLTSNDYYLCERGMYTNCTSANNGTTAAATTAKIGLMYVSDYMYASGYAASASPLVGSSYYNGSQNWMFKGEEWTITPNYSNERVFNVNYTSTINSIYTRTCYYIRPTFYLKEDVYVTGGDGSFDNPYTIACDTCNE